ncbi:acetate kinase [Snodgrassella sp. B3882]|uniref:acetate kinase n=1 Tax=Snodgrassella sp. B3882 TaxID=2818037 RepID=UPI00226AB7F6|nr:acetate kinase [Snodgrassella sp. B3882]MCX8744712.1 acetate kinase [Snodgrassella sp. B3882]
MSNQDLVLILNCGSSSVKAAVMDVAKKEVLMSCLAEKVGNPDAYITFKVNGEKNKHDLSAPHDHTAAVMALLDELKKLGLYDGVKAIGHRVVHGGERFTQSTVITPEVMRDIEACIVLAPLHNPAHILGIQAAQQAFPQLPQVAVFDTAFHQTMPPHAFHYAVPTSLYTKYGVRRYGAHGTSYRFVAQETAAILNRDINQMSMVIAHLGNGASITAVKNGQSQDTSMGLTPLEGLVMGTRSGDIDPSIFSFLAANANMSIDQVTEMLNKESGMLGLSNLSNDCRILEEAAANGDQGAELALNVFAYRLAKYVGSMTVAAGGLDALVFTGGIGENSDSMRKKVVDYLHVFGLKLDDQANLDARFGKSGVISTKDSKGNVLVVPTNEELMIALDTAELTGMHV